MVIIRVSVDRTRWDSLKISTHLNFGITPSSSVHTQTIGSMSGQRRARGPGPGECAKLAGYDVGDPREMGLSLGRLDGSGGLGLSLISGVEEVGFTSVPVMPHSHSSRGKRSKIVDLNDSGFHSVFEDDLEALEDGCECRQCSAGGRRDDEKTRRREPTPGIAVSLPTPLPSVLRTPTDGEALPLALPAHPYGHPGSQWFSSRREGGGQAAVSMGMFSASRSSVHLPLPGL